MGFVSQLSILNYCPCLDPIDTKVMVLDELMYKTLSVSPMLRPIMSETSKTAKIILVLYWTMDLI